MSDPKPDELILYQGQADSKDLPILVAALKLGCPYFLTVNVKHYTPDKDKITIHRPGEFVKTVRMQLALMSAEPDTK